MIRALTRLVGVAQARRDSQSSVGSGAAQASSDIARHQHDLIGGVAFFVLALLGPILGLIYGKNVAAADGFSETIAEGIRAGAYSLPLAIFGIVPFVVRIRSPQDYYGGAVLAAMALFAVWACNDLPGMRGFAFGPGTAPRMFAYCLLALGAAVALVGLLTDGPPAGEYSFSGPLGGAVLIVALIPITYYANKIGRWVPGLAPDIAVAALGAIVVLALAILLMRIVPRGPLFITAATLVFAVTVRPLGLVIASFVSLTISAYATHEIRWIETIIWAAVLTLFCALLFPYGLNLPLQLWPRY